MIERIFRGPWSINCFKKITYLVVESMWFKHLIIHHCPKLNFPSRRQFSQDILARLVEKTNELYILLATTECYYAIANFNLWMFIGGYDVFTLVINFLSIDW